MQRKKINKELLEDNAILIQKHYRIYRLRQQKSEVRQRLRLVMDTTTMRKLMRIKRRQIQSSKIELKEIINRIAINYESELNKVKEEVSDLKDLKENVEESLGL